MEVWILNWDEESPKNVENIEILMNNTRKEMPTGKPPLWFTELVSLKKLRLTGCGLEAIPDVVREMKKLEELDISINSIVEIPEWISELENLKTLFLSGNRIIDVNKVSQQECRLERLDLVSNKITAFDVNYQNLKRLKHLDLSNNKIEILSDDMGRLASLEYLFLDLNQIIKIPKTFSELKSLKELVLGNDDHKIEFIPDLRLLDELEKFSASNTSCVIQLSPEKLTQINIGYSDITEIPDFVYQSELLEVLNVQCTKVYHLDLNRLSRLKKLRYLHIGATNIFYEEKQKFEKMRPDVYFDPEGRTWDDGETELFRIKPGTCDIIECDCQQKKIHCYCDDCKGELYWLLEPYVKINRGCCDHH